MNAKPESKAYVLIVDDDPDSLRILSRIVQAFGLGVHTASDGLEALDVLRQAEGNAPGLILLDLLMPGMDGFGVFQRLRGDPKTRCIPVIVVTACSRGQVDLLRLPGVKEVVQKGEFTVPGFMQLIADTLGLARPTGRT